MVAILLGFREIQLELLIDKSKRFRMNRIKNPSKINVYKENSLKYAIGKTLKHLLKHEAL
jgi:hypothetical protein